MRLIPRETQFFDQLEALSTIVVAGARMLQETLEGNTTLDELYIATGRIHDLEHQADELVHRLIGRLNKTFITPLDREDIYGLSVRLDDVLDYVDSVAKRLLTFRITNATPHAVELGRILHRAAAEVAIGVHCMRNLNQAEQIRGHVARINQLENDADQVMRDALNELFNGGPRDPIEVIKWKDLYEHLEVATDKCEDVSNILETVLVKYS